MRYLLMLVSALGLLLAPSALHAQTEEIQREVETKLWIQRVLMRIEEATGAPPLVAVLTLLALVVTLVAAVWLWKTRRKRPG